MILFCLFCYLDVADTSIGVNVDYDFMFIGTVSAPNVLVLCAFCFWRCFFLWVLNIF